MTVPTLPGTPEWRAEISPPAAGVLEADAAALNSSSCGVVVLRSGVVAPGGRARAQEFLQEACSEVNGAAPDQVSAFAYAETFGERDRLHVAMHYASLDGYYVMRSEKDCQRLVDENQWNGRFISGTVQETVLLPQFWGMYGTKVDGSVEKQSDIYRSGAAVGLPPARQQTSLPETSILHSGNSGVFMHRSAQIRYDFRSEARQFGREVAESINKNLPGDCTVFVYEEAFGVADRLHWLIHLRDLSTYMRLLTLHVRDEEVRDIYFRDRLPESKGGGTWARMFIEQSMVDVALSALA